MSQAKPLHFKSVQVSRMPGFPPNAPFSLHNLAPGVNLITGPNASGKTTLAQAIEALLWPDRGKKACEVDGSFSWNDGRYDVKTEGHRRSGVLRDGQTSDAPPIPSSETASRYHVSLVELLQDDRRGQSFAQRISQETAGGYNLADAASDVKATPTPQNPRKLLRTLKECRSQVREVEKVQGQLSHSQASLKDLAMRCREAESAGSRAGTVQMVLELKKLELQRLEIQEEVDSFPTQLANLNGTELTSLKGLEDQRDELRVKFAQASRDADIHKKTVEETQLPDGGVSNQLLDEIRGELESLVRCEDRVEPLLEDVATVAGEVERAQQAQNESSLLLDGPFPENAGTELSAFAVDCEGYHARRQALERSRKLFEAQRGASKLGRRELHDGRRALVGWLQAASGAVVQVEPWRKPLRLVGLVLAVLGAGLAFAYAALAALALVGAILVFLGVPKNQTGSGVDGEHFKGEFQRLGLPEPSRWEIGEVQTHLRTLEDLEAEVSLQAEVEGRLRELALEEKELSALEESLNQRQADLLAKFGMAPPVHRKEHEAVFVDSVLRRSRLEEALQRQAGAKAQLAEVRRELEERRKHTGQLLLDCGGSKVETLQSARSMFKELESRQRRWAEGNAARREALHSMERYRTEGDSVEAKLDAFYLDLGFKEADRRTLESWLSMLEEYRGKEKELRDVERDIERVRGAVLQRPDSTALLDMEFSRLESVLVDSEKSAATLDTLKKDIWEIEKSVKETQANTALTDALGALRSQEDALRESRDAGYDSMASQVLVDAMKEEVRSHARPEVFRKANRLLAAFTGNRCSLDLDDGAEPRFIVRESMDGYPKSLNALSSGTRLQVLLAVRLAFAEIDEGAVQLPVVMDEILANSDEERALAIVKTGAALAAAGRQLFYFTAQQDEVSKWLAMSDHLGLETPHVVDLAQVRKLPSSTPAVHLRPAAIPEPPPAPREGENYIDYGRRLGVEPIKQGADSLDGIHLWHFLRDGHALYRMLQRDAVTYGRYRFWCAAQRDGVPTEIQPVAKHIDAIADALLETLNLWRKGRGKPVDRAFLLASSAVSETMQERVLALNERCEGDPEKLLVGLKAGEVARFQRSKADELQEALEEHGYLDQSPVVGRERARIEILERLATSIEGGVVTREEVLEIVERVYGP